MSDLGSWQSSVRDTVRHSSLFPVQAVWIQTSDLFMGHCVVISVLVDSIALCNSISCHPAAPFCWNKSGECLLSLSRTCALLKSRLETRLPYAGKSGCTMSVNSVRHRQWSRGNNDLSSVVWTLLPCSLHSGLLRGLSLCSNLLSEVLPCSQISPLNFLSIMLLLANKVIIQTEDDYCNFLKLFFNNNTFYLVLHAAYCVKTHCW